MDKQEEKAGDRPTLCACFKDGFAALPPELRPRPQQKSSLRQTTCPGCGLVYWTNRDTDFCMECDAPGAKQRKDEE